MFFFAAHMRRTRLYPLNLGVTTVRWCTGHSTVHCPVSATSADRWGLERLTVEIFCLLVALLTSALQTVCSQCSPPLGEVDLCSVVSTDSPVAHLIVR
jgi:hypothetical protein